MREWLRGVLTTATVLLVLAPAVVAADLTGGEADGSTSYDDPCLADVSNVDAPSPLDVTLGDNVHFYFYVSYTDTRSPGSSSVTHYFYLKAQWGVTDYVDDWRTYYTTGSASGGDTIEVVMYNIQSTSYTVQVTWLAQITSDPVCTTSSDQEVRTVQFT